MTVKGCEYGKAVSNCLGDNYAYVIHLTLVILLLTFLVAGKVGIDLDMEHDRNMRQVNEKSQC